MDTHDSRLALLYSCFGKCTAFVSFMTFSILQMIAAIVAGSEALVGDSAAMMVDALTYLLNWYAERQKRAYSHILQDGCDNDMVVLKVRKYHLQLELLPPLVSVTTLVTVIGLVLRNAIRILLLDAKRDVSLQSDPNVNLMLLCSIFNLLLDILNVFCFAKAKHALGYDTGVHNHEPVQEQLHLKSAQRLLDDDETGDRQKSSMEPLEIEQDKQEEKEESNLNMCSAYTVRPRFVCSFLVASLSNLIHGNVVACLCRYLEEYGSDCGVHSCGFCTFYYTRRSRCVGSCRCHGFDSIEFDSTDQGDDPYTWGVAASQ